MTMEDIKLTKEGEEFIDSVPARVTLPIGDWLVLIGAAKAALALMAPYEHEEQIQRILQTVQDQSAVAIAEALKQIVSANTPKAS